MADTVYLSHLTAWAPGLLADTAAWTDWAAGKKQIVCDASQPSLDYTEPLFRRRLSQLSRMTVEVVHTLVEESGCSRQTKLVFTSLRGEIDREFKINKTLIEENMILPASFSLSVFNTPVALATIALHLDGGYSAAYPSKGNFASAFAAAAAPVLAGSEKQLILTYGDELVPEAYGNLRPEDNAPFAFAALLSAEKPEQNAPCAACQVQSVSAKPAEFLRTMIVQGAMKKPHAAE